MINKILFACKECDADYETFYGSEESEKCRHCGEAFNFRTYPMVQCPCGAEVLCSDSWSNGCDCGREYNRDGSELAPRRFWGEETGEVFETYQED
jgi:hypothetical protein